MLHLGQVSANSQNTLLQTLTSGLVGWPLSATPWLHFSVVQPWLTVLHVSTPDSLCSGWWMSMHTTPHGSPCWPTLCFTVNESNGLRSDLYELPHVTARGWQCSSWAHRGITDICSEFSSLKIRSTTHFKSQGFVFCFLSCFAFLLARFSSSL